MNGWTCKLSFSNGFIDFFKSVTNQRTDQRTDGRTDQRTDILSYRDAIAAPKNDNCKFVYLFSEGARAAAVIATD